MSHPEFDTVGELPKGASLEHKGQCFLSLKDQFANGIKVRDDSWFSVCVRVLRAAPAKPAHKHPCKRRRREEDGKLKSPALT
jgi:hypothetical protein